VITLECKFCGESYEEYASRSSRSKYCSKACLLQDKAQTDLICACCGKHYQRPKSRAGSSNYCSWKCKQDAQSPQTLVCAYCGNEYQRIRSRLKKVRGEKSYPSRYCSSACLQADHFSRIPEGEPMSARTHARRKKEAGLVKPILRWRPFNEAFFDVWTDDLAWLLGLIWSDGCLMGNMVEICSKDRDLLETVAGILEMDDAAIQLKNRGTAYRIRFTSQRVAQILRGLGLVERKSLVANWPPMQEEYRSAFVRGLFDGDGSASLRQKRPGQQAPDLRVYFCGAAPCVRDGLHSWLNEHKIRFSVGRNANVWQICICEHASLKALYLLLYPGEQVSRLQRKKSNYDVWLATPRARSSTAISNGMRMRRKARSVSGLDSDT
jgi:hypothetical protein